MKEIIKGVTIEKENNYCEVYDNNNQYYDGECKQDCTCKDIYNSMKDYIEKERE